MAKTMFPHDGWNVDNESRWSPPESWSSRREPEQDWSWRCSRARPNGPRHRLPGRVRPNTSVEHRWSVLEERGSQDNSSRPAARPPDDRPPGKQQIVFVPRLSGRSRRLQGYLDNKATIARCSAPEEWAEPGWVGPIWQSLAGRCARARVADRWPLEVALRHQTLSLQFAQLADRPQRGTRSH